MAVAGGPKTETRGLVYGYDTGYGVADNHTSTIHYPGRPTTNLSSGYNINIYNNRGSDVSITNTVTSETYRGATVVKQTLTPITTTGVSYLTAGNNPGIGVVTSGGGGNANTYTGHSIFFKPTVDMHSSPIYTHYSNISGYQSSANYYDMGDGWYRAHVIWYRDTAGSDGKYWAINPETAILNHPITIYWAGPFKENLNSTSVTPYVHTSRSTTQSLIDLSGNNTITNGTGTYSSTQQPLFDSTDDYISAPGTQYTTAQAWTADMIVNPSNVADNYWNPIFGGGLGSGGYWMFHSNRLTYYEGSFAGTTKIIYTDRYIGTHFPQDTYKHLSIRYNANSTFDIFINGEKFSYSYTFGGSYSMKLDRVGAASSRYGSVQVPAFKFHNVALTDQEIQQNYLSYKNRFSL